MAYSRRGGISLAEIRAEFDVSHSTAQRMTDELEATFANVENTDGADRRRRWRLLDPAVDAGKLATVLLGQFVPMRQHAGLGIALTDHVSGHWG